MSEIIPSILTNDLGDFKKKLETLKEFTKTIQIDIMDGKFVNNTSFDLKIENHDLNQYLNTNLNTDTKLELHLMVNHPIDYIEKWEGAKNISRIIFHIESNDNPNEVIEKIKGLNLEIGIAINPETSIEKLEPYLDKIDLVLFMSVVPGKQGGKFLPEISKKIKEFKNKKLNKKLLLANDGGVNEKTIEEIKTWGIDIIGVGSAIIKTDNPKGSYQKLLKLI